MRFHSLRRHWDRLGRRDPYWAALTDPGKRGGGWDIAQFFSSGAAEIDAALGRAHRLGVAVTRGRALDFGCGAGRLTQAMATHFTRCDGVDISAAMLQIAREHNRYPDRCAYHLNVSTDLALFGDQSFDFVYSTLVLQHMEPRYSKHYIRELMRVLAPAGLLVFQLPSQRSAQEPPVDARRTPTHGRLPSDAFRAWITTEPVSLVARPGEQLTVEVAAENRSPYIWPALPNASGRCQVKVANHWLHEDGELLQRDDGRCPLPFDVTPGSRVSVMLIVTAPRVDGRYLLELDLVQEDVEWFGERGSPTLHLPVVVGNGLAAPRRPPKTAIPPPPQTAVPPPPPFRSRHPRAFQIMRATGVRDAYWAWRRALDRGKVIRDQLVVDLRYRVNLPRVINWWRRGPFSARMDAQCAARRGALDPEGRGRPGGGCGRGMDAGLSELSILGEQGLTRTTRRLSSRSVAGFVA